MQSEEADLFDGVFKVDGTACICPQLVHWISEELKRTADIDKAARKACEERVLVSGAEHLTQPPLNVQSTNEVAKEVGKAQR